MMVTITIDELVNNNSIPIERVKRDLPNGFIGNWDNTTISQLLTTDVRAYLCWLHDVICEITDADLPFLITEMDFLDLDLRCSDLLDAEIKNVNFTGSNLNGASFAHCTMTNVDFSNCNLQDSAFDSAELIKCKFNNADLSGASLCGADFVQCDIKEWKIDKNTAMFDCWFSDKEDR